MLDPGKYRMRVAGITLEGKYQKPYVKIKLSHKDGFYFSYYRAPKNMSEKMNWLRNRFMYKELLVKLSYVERGDETLWPSIAVDEIGSLIFHWRNVGEKED